MPKRTVKIGASTQELLRTFKASVFQALAHPTRIHIMELLKDKEYSVSELLAHLGVEQSNASQHLTVLRSKNLVTARKDGNQIFYSLRDPVLGQVLRPLKEFFQSHLEESKQILRDLK